MKTYGKAKVIEMLQDGMILVHDNISTRTWIVNEIGSGRKIAAVKFDTYLQIYKSLTKTESTFTLDFYKLA